MLWVKAFHIISVICWFAALFYLPRLFVYHSMSEDKISKERFKIMERKLYRGIATPSMVATLVFGGWLASAGWEYYSGSTWFWIKVGLVLILIGYHHMCAKFLRLFRDEQPVPGHVFFRWFNEFPVFLLVAIVILVVVKQPS